MVRMRLPIAALVVEPVEPPERRFVPRLMAQEAMDWLGDCASRLVGAARRTAVRLPARNDRPTAVPAPAEGRRERLISNC